MGAVLATVAGGVLYGLAFPTTAWWWLAWIALTPLIVVARGRSLRGAALAGALYGIVGTCATVSWLPHTVVVYYAQSIVVGLALFLTVTLLMVAPPVAAFGAAVRLTTDAPAALRPLLVAAAWIAAEFWRSQVLGGNPWVLVGYSQARVGPVVQVADLAGVFGVGFVVVVVNAAFAELALALVARTSRRDAAVSVGVAGVVLAATIVYGTRARARLTEPDRATVAVTVVQGNLDLGSQWQEEFYGRNLEAYLRLTLDALRARPARLVVWPEAAMTFFLASDRLYQSAIGHALRPLGAELVAGGPYAVPGSDSRFRNAAFAIDPSGAIRGRYDKERLLPFAEYFPFPSLDILRRSFGRVREFTPGDPAPAPLPTAAGGAGVLICNEAMFGEVARSRVRAGAEILLVLTNDTWVGDPQFAAIAADMAVLRAVETRRWLVRASTAGPSMIVDPSGRIRGAAAFGVPATVAGEIAPRAGFTVYTRAGDVFAFGCAAATLAGVVWALTRRGR